MRLAQTMPKESRKSIHSRSTGSGDVERRRASQDAHTMAAEMPMVAQIRACSASGKADGTTADNGMTNSISDTARQNDGIAYRVPK